MSTPSVAQVRRFLQAGDLTSAEIGMRQLLIIAPNAPEILQLSADLAIARNDWDTAISIYWQIMKSVEKPSAALLQTWIEALIRSGHPYDAVDVLKQAIDLHPRITKFHADLIGLSAAIGVAEESLLSLQLMVRHGMADLDVLTVLADAHRVEVDEEYLQKLLDIHGDRPKLQFGFAVNEANAQRWQRAADRLRPLLLKKPEFAAAQFLYARCLVELGDLVAVSEWLERLPSGLTKTTQYWLAAAHLSQLNNSHAEACRAYWECLKLNPGYLPSLIGLRQCLQQLQRNEEAEQIGGVIARETYFRNELNRFFELSGQSQNAAIKVAETLLTLGRVWEAEAWGRISLNVDGEPVTDIKARYLAIREQLTPQTPWVLAEHDVVLNLALSDLPLPSWVGSTASRHIAREDQDIHPRFSEQAIIRGFHHNSLFGVGQHDHGYWIYQTVGGGVSVIDYDLDGWPDLASAVLNGRPMEEDSSPNALHRNMGGHFSLQSSPAGYNDRGFGQGIAVGDYNDDGFPDLLDANIGRNRLYRNNGDGTFSDVTDESGLQGERWSTSVVIVDINSDGWADIYETCYCSGDEPYRHQCGGDSEFVTCSPLVFAAEPDVISVASGDARFTESRSVLDRTATPGRGMGVVAGNLDERLGLDLYVTNDMSSNHLWSYQSDPNGWRLDELGAIRGLGLSGRSVAQASMGIAAGDPDLDGDIDFYVTHFSKDYNTYYEQVAPGSWLDRTAQADLLQPTMSLLGFGTQWIDIANRGQLELFVANGHVNKLEQDDIEYHMAPQLFHRVVNGQWEQYEPQAVGEYFEGKHLGRAVSRADFDRDGRLDLVVSHVDETTALLINQTEDVGNSVRFFLRARTTQRDAIGAKVEGVVRDRNVTCSLLAGDGYMCANEQCLHFGLGDAEEITDIRITWPSGRVDHCDALQAGHDYLWVEADSTPFQFQRPP